MAAATTQFSGPACCGGGAPTGGLRTATPRSSCRGPTPTARWRCRPSAGPAQRARLTCPGPPRGSRAHCSPAPRATSNRFRSTRYGTSPSPCCSRCWWAATTTPGAALPVGAHMCCLVFPSTPPRAVVGCLQFSTTERRTVLRDHWVCCDDTTRARNLQHLVNNSGHLLLTPVAVRNLATAVLARGLPQLVMAWPRHHRLERYLAETHGGSPPPPRGLVPRGQLRRVPCRGARRRMDRHRPRPRAGERAQGRLV